MYLISDGGASCNTKDTMEAIMLTKNISYIDGIKLDIYMSKDNILVVCQDNDLKKFTLSNKCVSDSNYEYLRKVKFPSHIFKYYIPTLEEVLINYNQDKIIVLDFKRNDNLFINNLYNLLIKYPYNYYFLNKHNKLESIGTILDDYKNLMIITRYPEKMKNK